MLGARSGLAARFDTAVFVHVTAQHIGFFIIDLGFVYTKIADPFAAETTTAFTSGTSVSHHNLQSCQGLALFIVHSM
jgi:hypothetical protein